MPTPVPPLDVRDRPLDFWERGPIRQILELEFEAALLRAIGERGMRVTAETEQIIHDAVVPEAFLFVTQAEGWSPEEEGKGRFTLAHQQAIQREMARLIANRLAQAGEGPSGVPIPFRSLLVPTA